LDVVLIELEDGGLMGWDKQANRYDLHPIVRGVIWAALGPETKQGMYRELHTYFEAAPKPDPDVGVATYEELTVPLELFNTLIGMGRLDDAFSLFEQRIALQVLYGLGLARRAAELLEQLFVRGTGNLPQLSEAGDQCSAMVWLAHAYVRCGNPQSAAVIIRQSLDIFPLESGVRNDDARLPTLAMALFASGALRAGEAAMRKGIMTLRRKKRVAVEGLTIIWAVLGMAARGAVQETAVMLQRARNMAIQQEVSPHELVFRIIDQCEAQLLIWKGRATLDTLRLSELPSETRNLNQYGAALICAARLQGQAALVLGDHATADERLHRALSSARAVNLAEEELPVLAALAELHRQRRQYDEARELLEQVWAPAQRGPYPLWHADARIVLAKIERDEGRRDAAIAAATRAYELAWCDGPPYAYHYGLMNAKALLKELGAPEPQLPPFDESKFEPLPDVELNPKDEFWVDPATLDSNP
jgi:tetratricopeptide (TPR) repeat protein